MSRSKSLTLMGLFQNQSHFVTLASFGSTVVPSAKWVDFELAGTFSNVTLDHSQF